MPPPDQPSYPLLHPLLSPPAHRDPPPVLTSGAPSASALAAARAGAERAREHAAAASPRVWQGTAAENYLDRRAEDLARADAALDSIERASAAVASFEAARRALAADLAAAFAGTLAPGLPWLTAAGAAAGAGVR